jgi:hypothetical protein
VQGTELIAEALHVGFAAAPRKEPAARRIRRSSLGGRQPAQIAAEVGAQREELCAEARLGHFGSRHAAPMLDQRLFDR